MSLNIRFRIVRSHRHVSVEERREEVVLEFSQPPKRCATEGLVTQERPRLTVSPRPIVDILKCDQ